jgi:hypothetical protein
MSKLSFEEFKRCNRSIEIREAMNRFVRMIVHQRHRDGILRVSSDVMRIGVDDYMYSIQIENVMVAGFERRYKKRKRYLIELQQNFDSIDIYIQFNIFKTRVISFGAQLIQDFNDFCFGHVNEVKIPDTNLTVKKISNEEWCLTFNKKKFKKLMKNWKNKTQEDVL